MDKKTNIYRSGEINGQMLRLAEKLTVVGAIPAKIDAKIEKEIRRLGARPAFKGYQGYPASTCISVNDMLVHGIPNNTPLKAGDVVSIDIGVSYNGWITDAAITVALEPITSEVKTLITATREALDAGVKQAIIGNKIGDISFAIEQVARNYHLSIARDLTGHGVGQTLHESPSIPNFGKKNEGDLIKAGMALAIEPMFSTQADIVTKEGTRLSKINIAPDGWGIYLKKGSIGAHFEHTVYIDKNPVIITA